jgi:GH15 family glucan-1,4-alpha-glucosidase
LIARKPGAWGTLDLAPIGNCTVSALIDRQARFVWSCLPRVDGDPLFSALLGAADPADEATHGHWSIDLDGFAQARQHYIRNSAVLMTVLESADGDQVEVVDFAPRYVRDGRTYRPTAFCRVIRPVAGSPRIRVRLRPTTSWGARKPDVTSGSNHIRYLTDGAPLRLTTDVAVGHILDERWHRLEGVKVLFLGPDEPFDGNLSESVRIMHDRTISEWQTWVRGLALPLEWQAQVIRAAIALKLCQHEETGAIVAALTTSIPEAPRSARNWDYRYCWLRDAYYTVQALNRLGALDVLEGYLGFLRNIVDTAAGGHVQPLYGVGMEALLPERAAPALPGYRGMGPVRVGNQAHEHLQHDVYGQIILSSVQAFFDERLFRPGVEADFRALEAVGERAFLLHDQPDAGLWEFRTRARVHTYSALMCWAGCDRLGNAAEALGLDDRAVHWRARAAVIAERIQTDAWSPALAGFSASFGTSEVDASLLQMIDLRFLEVGDARFAGTFAAVETALRRGDHMLRYVEPDDFGTPETAFNFCTFWLIEALHLCGRGEEARRMFESTLTRLTHSGLLSEDTDMDSGELWGNFPQTYSLVGLINCAGLLSRPWTSVR